MLSSVALCMCFCPPISLPNSVWGGHRILCFILVLGTARIESTVSNHSNGKQRRKPNCKPEAVFLVQSLSVQNKPIYFSFGGEQRNLIHLSDASRICSLLCFSAMSPHSSRFLMWNRCPAYRPSYLIFFPFSTGSRWAHNLPPQSWAYWFAYRTTEQLPAQPDQGLAPYEESEHFFQQCWVSPCLRLQEPLCEIS